MSRRTPPVLGPVVAILANASLVLAAPTPPLTPDIPATFVSPDREVDHVRREFMIPMRDGVKLHTVVLVPKGAKGAPMMLTRTPYNADKRSTRGASRLLTGTVSSGDELTAGNGYIHVYQDVRGKYRSEGDYVMTRPLRGPLNDSKVDHSTDAYDTIDWLVKHVPESNGKVGMIGSSYEGFTVLMALIHPHPALKVAIPMNPMVDGWKGDDWFHYGAFRQINFDFFVGQNSARADGKSVRRAGYDDYENFRRAGSAGDYAKLHGIDQLPFFTKVTEHAAYDAFWQHQAVDRLLAKEPLTVPTMVVASIWDQEDSYGAIAAYQALEPKDTRGDKCFLVLGPWAHSGMKRSGRSLGPVELEGDTALQFRRDTLHPFLDAHLRGASASTPAVLAYETGTQRWRRLPAWPPAGTSRKLYLQPGGGAGLVAPTKGDEHTAYVSDPGKPIPYQPRPVRFDDSAAWRTWLLADQRAVADRPDVVSFVTEPLTTSLKVAGAPTVQLFASTTGSDADWVVKLIDVYPEEYPARPELGGYQLPVAMDIFRGRYRQSLERPTAIPANQVQRYQFALPTANHVFLPGHRIMVQIQSSWFPLYDRNPQTFVENIFFAKPGDYKPATHRVFHRGASASFVELPTAR